MNSILNWLFRIILAMALLCVTAFCTFGFLASFEPGNGWQWQAGYGALVCGGLVGAVAVLRQTRAPTLGALALFALTMLCVLGFMESYLSSAGQVGYGDPWLHLSKQRGRIVGTTRKKRKRPDNGSGLTHGDT